MPCVANTSTAAAVAAALAPQSAARFSSPSKSAWTKTCSSLL